MCIIRALQSVKQNLGISFVIHLHHECAELGNESNLAQLSSKTDINTVVMVRLGLRPSVVSPKAA